MTVKNKFCERWDVGSEFIRFRRNCKDNGKTIVFTNGCFDVFHAGHAWLLNMCKTLPWIKNPILVVGLNDDDSVRRLKGAERPIMPFLARAYVLASFAAVDYVVGFTEDTPEVLLRVCEDVMVLVKGSDVVGSPPGTDYVSARGGAVVFAPVIKGISTSKILCRDVEIDEYENQQLQALLK